MNRLSKEDFINSNTLGRSIAIVLVVLCHLPATGSLWAILGPFVASGKLAVSLFIFYSGVLLEYNANNIKHSFSIHNWLLKRFLRIYPTYWIALVFTLFVGIVFNAKNYKMSIVLANLSGVPLWMGAKVINSGYRPHFWFISLILLCYTLFVLFHTVRRKESLVVSAILFCLAGIYTRHGHYLSLLAFTPFFLVC